MAAVEIDLGKLPFDIDFHPSDNLVAAGLITGDLLLHRYNTDSQAQKLLEVNAHSESCRTVRFINEGRAIVTGSPDCSILAIDIETGSEIVHLENSHGAAVNRIVNLTESTIASGDDEGCIKLDEDRVITGCENGLISLVGILPNKIIQPIAFSRDKKYLGSASHDHLLKLWDLNELVQDSEDVAKNDSTAEDSDNDGMDVDDDVPKSSKGSKKKNVNKGQDPGSSNNFFAEL